MGQNLDIDIWKMLHLFRKRAGVKVERGARAGGGSVCFSTGQGLREERERKGLL